MFKDQILTALKTKYKAYGLSMEALDRIAVQLEKTVTKEEDIDGAISGSEAMDSIARELVSMRDKEIRNKTDLQSVFDKYKAEHPEAPSPNPNPNPNPQPDSAVTLESIKKLMDDAVEKATSPLMEKIAALENTRSAEVAIASAKEKFFAGDYAKKYKSEAEAAWDRAVEINEVTGNKMTADQLSEKVNGYFNAAVSRLGVDTSKPFQADPPAGDDEGVTDWSAEVERQKKAGKIVA